MSCSECWQFSMSLFVRYSWMLTHTHKNLSYKRSSRHLLDSWRVAAGADISVRVLEDKFSSSRILEDNFEVLGLGLESRVLGLANWVLGFGLVTPSPWKNSRTHSSPIIACFAQTTSRATEFCPLPITEQMCKVFGASPKHLILCLRYVIKL